MSNQQNVNQKSLKVWCGALVILPLGMFLLASCGPDSSETGSTRLSDTGKPALHAVHGDRLAEAMEDLNVQLAELTRARIYVGSDAEPDMKRVRKAAASIADTTAYIPNALSEMELSKEDRRVFLRLTNKLEQEARALEEAAAKSEVPAARAAVDRMMGTCNACHASFRLTPIDAGEM
jgi:cytochrome c556